MATENHAVNIYLNEAAVEASLEKMQTKAASLETQMTKAANPAEWAKLDKQLQETNGKIDTLGKQLSGEIAPSMRQMEANVTKLRNELKNTATNTQEFTDKAKKLSEAEGALKKVQTEAYGVSKAIAETGKGGGVFDTLKDKVMGFAKTIPGLGQVMNVALGPLGIFIGILTGLGALLFKNAEFADKFSYVMGGLNKIVHTLADDLYNLVTKGLGGLKAAIENPKQALADFGNAIVENVINRFKAFAVIIDAITTRDFKKLGDGVIQLVSGVKDGTSKIQAFGEHLYKAGEEGYSAAQKLDELTTQQAKLKNAIAQTQIAIEQQTTAMKDGTLTDEERLNAAKKVVELETLNANRRISSIQLELNALKEKTKGIQLSNEEEAQLMDLQTAKIQEVANKEAAIRKAKNKVAELEAAASAQRIKDTSIVEITTITEVAKAASDLVGDFSKKSADTATFHTRKFVDEFDQQSDKWRSKLQKFMGEWGETIGAGIQAVNMLVGAGMELTQAKANNELAHEKKITDQKKKQFKDLLDAKKITQAQYNTAIDGLDQQLAAKQLAAKKKQFAADKAARIAMAVINTAAAIVSAFATSGNIYTAIALSAVAAAVGAAQIGIIAATPAPEYAKGGVARGASHAAGGISMINADGRKVGEMEDDEPYMILSKTTYRNNGRLIDALLDTSMNKGGARLNIGPQPKFNFGGVFNAMQVTKYAAGGVFTPGNDGSGTNELMNSLLDRLNQPLYAQVVYQDITEKGAALNRASERASFSKP